MSQKSSTSLTLGCESAVINTTAEAPANSSRPQQGSWTSMCLWKQHGSQTSTWFSSAAQTTDVDVASGGSTDHRSPSRRLGQATLHLYHPAAAQSQGTGLVDSVSEGKTQASSRLPHNTLPLAPAARQYPGHKHCSCSLRAAPWPTLPSPQQGRQLN